VDGTMNSAAFLAPQPRPFSPEKEVAMVILGLPKEGKTAT